MTTCGMQVDSWYMFGMDTDVLEWNAEILKWNETGWNGMGYLESANESVCDEFLGIEDLYLHYLVKHCIRHLLEVVIQHLV